MPTGKVSSWRGGYGFVMADDHTPVYVHTDDIDGGRLRVGLEVTFEIVDGKDGKPRGEKVTGEGVLAKGVELTEEQKDEDKKRERDAREGNKERSQAEYKEMLDKVLALDNRTQREILARLTKEFALGKEEKRTDPTQKTSRSYTKGEFVAFYGQKEGERRWKEAGNKGTKKVVKKAERQIVRE